MRRLLGLLVLLVVAALAWVGVRGYMAHEHGQAAAEGLARVQTAVESGDIDTARSDLSYVQDDTRAAARLTSDPVWTTMARFPWGGQNLQAVTTTADAADDVMHDGVPGLLDAADALQEFTTALEGGEVDSEALQEAADGVTRLDESLGEGQARIQALDGEYLLPQTEAWLLEIANAMDLTAQVRAYLAGQVPTFG